MSKLAGKFFVEDGAEIYKCDKAGNWYVFRHGSWNNYSWNRDEKPEWLISEHKNLASARKACLKQLVKSLEKLKLGSDADLNGFRKSHHYQKKDDENAPFWSETYLYCLIGKEAGRTILSYLRRLDDISKAY